MSSDMKDARWALAYYYAELEGKSFLDFSYEGWEDLLSRAQDFLDDEAEDVVAYWAEEFRGE